MSTINYRPDVQGLRAVAVVAVILFHFNPAWLPGGFIGVDVFLAISGYLIVRILHKKRAHPDYEFASTLRYFYASRLKRIVPAYFLMLVLVSLLAAVLFLPQDLAIYKQGLKQAAWFNSNRYFAGFGDYFAPASHEQPLLHTWSLAVEIQFYLLIPFLVLLLPARPLLWLLVALLVGLTAMAEYRLRILGIRQETYFSLYARLPAFFIGAIAAIWTHANSGVRRVQPWFGTLGLALVLVSAVVQPMLGPFPGILALLPVAGAALMLLRPAQGAAGQLLASQPIVWLGALSYSLYLWHWPILALLRYYTGSPVLDMPFAVLFVLLTLLLATISYYLVETPLRADRSRPRQMLSYGLLAGVALATGPTMATINQALTPAPLPIEYQRYADPTSICHSQITTDCLKGDLNSDKEVLVLGDSHAAMLNVFFDKLGQELGFKARIISASSCVTIPGFDYQRIAEWAQKPCLAQIEQVQKYLPNAEIVFLAANWSWQLASSDFQNALNAFLSAQTQASVRVYLLEQAPLLRNNPLRAQRFNALGLVPIIDIDPAYQQANASLQRLIARHPGAVSLNFEASGLFTRAPFADGILIYLDEHHLNEVGAKTYAAAARSAFTEILN